MKVVIMAGGKGTRISSVASDIPKPMIKMDGIPVRVGGGIQRTGVRAYPLFVLAEILMKKLSGIVEKIYE